MKRVALAVSCGFALLILAVVWVLGASAQQPAGGQGQARFTGATKTMGPHTIRVGSGHIHFEPGARTWWHSHRHGQVMIVEQGRGRHQNHGEPVREFAVGDTAYAPPNVMHWHGAAPDRSMTQVSVSVGETTWGGEVSEADYLGGGKSTR